MAQTLHEDTLVALLDELTDAALDTIELALSLEPNPKWDSHVDYLRRLRREANTFLARASSETPFH
jgi:hypothetical protein